MNFKELIESFVDGAKEGKSSGQGNLFIRGEALIHYMTPILERAEDKYILNYTRYSLVTGRVQKQIEDIIPSEIIIKVKGVPEGYKGSLNDFVKEV